MRDVSPPTGRLTVISAFDVRWAGAASRRGSRLPNVGSTVAAGATIDLVARPEVTIEQWRADAEDLYWEVVTMLLDRKLFQTLHDTIVERAPETDGTFINHYARLYS